MVEAATAAEADRVADDLATVVRARFSLTLVRRDGDAGRS